MIERLAAIPRSPLRVTLALIVVNVFVYAVMLVGGSTDDDGSFTRQTLIAFGGIYAPLVRQGEWWRLFAAAFVHASAAHLVWNMLSLWFLGRYLEARYAAGRYLGVYLLGALASSLATLAWYWTTPIVAIGASGAICALIGAGAVSAWRMGVRGMEFRNSMLGWAIVVLVNGVTNHANNVAHGSGLASGAGLVFAFGRRGIAALTPRERGSEALGLVDQIECSSCGELNPRESRFCGRCGKALTLPAGASG